MTYEPPTTRYYGELRAVLDSLRFTMPKAAGNVDWRVRRLQRFVDTQDGKLGDDLEIVCQQMNLGVSGSHAARLFRQQVGMGVREYAKRRRLTVAADRLKTTALSVKEIAIDLGYRRPSDLQRQFKRLFYLSPTVFRTVYRRSNNLKHTM